MTKSESLKVGDVCRVVGNCNRHGFGIGEKVRLNKVWDGNTYNRGVGFHASCLCGTEPIGNIVREIDLEKVEEIGRLKEFTKSDLQELDIVVLRKGIKGVFFQGNLRGDGVRIIEYYDNNLLRCDDLREYDIVQVIRNKEVIWERFEKSPIQIELEKLEKEQRAIADKIAELRREI